jgi:hypothetical protein
MLHLIVFEVLYNIYFLFAAVLFLDAAAVVFLVAVVSATVVFLVVAVVVAALVFLVAGVVVEHGDC